MAEVLKPNVLLPQWVYLALGADAIPLLKRGFLPLQPLSMEYAPWWLQPAPIAQTSISEKEYLAHMEREFGKLPDSLKGLLDFEQFLQQAQPKRCDIEAAIRKTNDLRQQAKQPDASAWLQQSFYSLPYHSLSWQHHRSGYGAIWLAIDHTQLSAQISPVRYRIDQPARYSERLMSAPMDQEPLQQYRLLLQKNQLDRFIDLNGCRHGLLRLPPKAVKAALLGAQVSQTLKSEFCDFWRMDFRYQRSILAQMKWSPGDYDFAFERL